MRFSLRHFALGVSALSLIFFCSCERHHAGELPEAQVTDAAQPTHDDARAEATSPRVNATPADFFPENKKP